MCPRHGMTLLPPLLAWVDLAQASRPIKLALARDIRSQGDTRNRPLSLANALRTKTGEAHTSNGPTPVTLRVAGAKGLRTRMAQLIDGDDIDVKTGKITCAMPLDRPYDWAKTGEPRLFAATVTPAGLAEIKTYADGIGPWKPYIVPVKGQLDAAGRLVDVNRDRKIGLRDASTPRATTLVADAHKAGLFVHAFTFRNEKRRLAFDGVFADFPDTARVARAVLPQDAKR